MLILFYFLGFIIFVLLIVALIEHFGKKKDMRQEMAWRQYKISIGADPTFDEYGNLRK